MLRLMRYLSGRHWCYAAVSVVLIVLQVYLDLKLPEYISQITVLVETPGSTVLEVLEQGVYMLLCTLASVATSVGVGLLAAVVAAGFSQRLRLEVFSHTVSLSEREVNQFSLASLINRTTNDITQVQFLVVMGMQVLIKAPILALWALGKISGSSWQWTLSMVVTVCLVVVLLVILYCFAVPRFKLIQGLTDVINRVAREQLTGVRVIRAYAAESYQEEKFAKGNQDLTHNNLIANRVMALMQPAMTMLNSGLTLAVYWFGAYIIEDTSPGDKLTVFSQMVVFSNYAIQVILAFIMLNFFFLLLPRAQVSARRINQVLSTVSSIRDKTTIKDGIKENSEIINKNIEKVAKCHINEQKYEQKSDNVSQTPLIEFQGVDFSYAGSKLDQTSTSVKPQLQAVSFSVYSGETVAIIGGTGSGKTTAMLLIPRFYDVTRGSVLVGGRDVRDYRLSELRARIGFVTQKAVLFSGSVYSNVAYGDRKLGEFTDAEVTESLCTAQAWSFVEQMPGKLQATVAPQGTNLSGGQKQRLSIARALARKPEILIFDDSFSALDNETERAVFSGMLETTAGITKLIVAQKISTVRQAERILVFDQGRLVGNGTEAELMQTCATYQKICEAQGEEIGS